MSNDIQINASTTAQQLFDEVYENNQNTFGTVYAELLKDHPEYATVINEAWIKTSTFDLAFDTFKEYIFELINESEDDIPFVG